MGSSLEGLDPVFRAKVEALLRLAGGRVTIKSGHRTTQRQSQLWNAALAKYGSAAKARKWVAPPGRSNHEKGNAVDFGGDLKLVARLAPGLGLHQPLSNEPWHYEPVGSRKATGSVRAAERRMADQATGSRTPAAPAIPGAPEVDRRAFTVEYQLANLGQILMGGGSGTPDEG